MSQNYDLDTDDALITWLQAEQWFLRILGADLLLIAILGLIFGTLRNANNEPVITAVNVVISIIMALGGLWTLYASSKPERIEAMVEGFIEQGNSNTQVFAVIQIVVGLLFLLEGLSRGQIVMLLIGLTMMAAAAFFFWRAKQITRHQS